MGFFVTNWGLPARGILCASCLLVASTSFAEVSTVSRTVKGDAGKDIRIGVFVNVSKDCKSGPLPSIRLSSPPQNGKVTVRQIKIRATNYKECLAMEVPGFAAFYRSRPNFAGVDQVGLEVNYPNGLTQNQTIIITIGAMLKEQGI